MARLATAFRHPLGAGYTKTTEDNDRMDDGTYHVGEDWGGPLGGRVSAAANGVVIMAGKVGATQSWGNLVVVEHTLPDGNKATSIYGHLDTISVKPGQDVGIGDKLGTVGDTGMSDGVHLHFSIYAGDLNGAIPIGHAKGIDKDLASSGYVDPTGFIANHPEITFSSGSDSKALWYAGGTWNALGGNDTVHGSAGADTILSYWARDFARWERAAATRRMTAFSSPPTGGSMATRRVRNASAAAQQRSSTTG